MRGHAACESPLRPGELLIVGGRAPASSKKLEQDSQIEFFDDEVDVDDGTLKVRACVKIKLYGAFVLNRRVILHAIDARPA